MRLSSKTTRFTQTPHLIIPHCFTPNSPHLMLIADCAMMRLPRAAGRWMAPHVPSLTCMREVGTVQIVLSSKGKVGPGITIPLRLTNAITPLCLTTAIWPSTTARDSRTTKSIFGLGVDLRRVW